MTAVRSRAYAALLLLLAGGLISCRDHIVELLPSDAPPMVDASPDAPANPDASLCVCRIVACQNAIDCAAIGMGCGPDRACVGYLSTCASDADCNPGDLCTASPTTLDACPR